MWAVGCGHELHFMERAMEQMATQIADAHPARAGRRRQDDGFGFATDSLRGISEVIFGLKNSYKIE